MKALEIALQVAKILGKEELVQFMTEGVSEDISQAKKDKEKITECIKDVVFELASTTCKLKCEEVFLPTEKRVYFKDFSNRVLSVAGVYDMGGKSVKFTLFPTYVALYGAEKVNIVYNYLPKSFLLEEDIPLGSTLIDERVLSYGVVAEYYLKSSLYEEAVIWRDKYEKNLSKLFSSKNYKIKGRAFN